MTIKKQLLFKSLDLGFDRVKTEFLRVSELHNPDL